MQTASAKEQREYKARREWQREMQQEEQQKKEVVEKELEQIKQYRIGYETYEQSEWELSDEEIYKDYRNNKTKSKKK